jgi:predicted DNA-binding transcriptional regulator YafY
MNRIDRLSAILIQLQSRKTLRAQDIADRFGISLRTVYRDVRSLEEAGIPVIGEAGIGYSLVEGYRLPPVMFTREEATAFITAEKLVSSLTDAANGNSYSLALDKVRAVLKTADKDYLEHIDDRIEVVKHKQLPKLSLQHNPLQTILNAIAAKRVVKLGYFAYYRQEHTNRLIEPVGVFYLDNYWHLIAWCRERKAYRDFRFDRILDICTTEEQFNDQHPSLKSYLSEQYKDMKLEEVTILVEQDASLHLGEQKYYQGFVSEKQTPAGVEMQFLTMSIEGFARWYMSFADYATILKPELLQNRVKSIFSAISKNMENF